MICSLVLLAGKSNAQEVKINVPVYQNRLLEADAGSDIFMDGQDSVLLGENLKVVGGLPDFSYEWRDLSGNSFEGRYVYTEEPGSYYITVVDKDNCQALDSLKVLNAVFDSERKAVQYYLYPNPSDGTTFIPLINSGSPVLLKIISSYGAVIYEKTYSPLYGEKQLQLNLKNLDSGFYLVQVSDRYSTRTYTWIKK